MKCTYINRYRTIKKRWEDKGENTKTENRILKQESNGKTHPLKKRKTDTRKSENGKSRKNEKKEEYRNTGAMVIHPPKNGVVGGKNGKSRNILLKRRVDFNRVGKVKNQKKPRGLTSQLATRVDTDHLCKKIKKKRSR